MGIFAYGHLEKCFLAFGHPLLIFRSLCCLIDKTQEVPQISRKRGGTDGFLFNVHNAILQQLCPDLLHLQYGGSFQERPVAVPAVEMTDFHG